MDIDHSTTEITPPKEQDDYNHLKELRRKVEEQLEKVREQKQREIERVAEGPRSGSDALDYASVREDTLQEVLEWIDQECLHPEDDVTTMYGERGPDGTLCNRCGKVF